MQLRYLKASKFNLGTWNLFILHSLISEFINNFSFVSLNCRVRDWLSCTLATSYARDDTKGVWNDFLP